MQHHHDHLTEAAALLWQEITTFTSFDFEKGERETAFVFSECTGYDPRNKANFRPSFTAVVLKRWIGYYIYFFPVFCPSVVYWALAVTFLMEKNYNLFDDNRPKVGLLHVVLYTRSGSFRMVSKKLAFCKE